MKNKSTFYTILISLSFLLFGSLQKSMAQTLLPIPDHFTIYNTGVRGYWFTAPTDFVITGLKVPSEAGTGTQNIQIFSIEGVPSEYPQSESNFTNLAYIKGAPNGVIQNVNINVTAGTKIGIFGAAGTNTSYSWSVTPYITTIGVHSVELKRLLYQGDIDVNSAPNYSVESSGPLGRIEMYYTCIKPTADAIITDEVSPCLFNFSVDNAQNADSYAWDFGDGSPIATGTTTVHSYAASGSYIVKAILINDCDSTTVLKAVACATTGIDENYKASDHIQLYPNPVTDILTIKSKNNLGIKSIAIINIIGQQVFQATVQNNEEQTFNVAHLASGIYAVHIETDQGLLIKKLEIVK